MSNEPTHRCDLQEDWTPLAQKAGLEHVDGWDNRSVLVGTLEQWKAFQKTVEDLDVTGWTPGEKGSRTRALKRIRWVTSGGGLVR